MYDHGMRILMFCLFYVVLVRADPGSVGRLIQWAEIERPKRYQDRYVRGWLGSEGPVFIKPGVPSRDLGVDQLKEIEYSIRLNSHGEGSRYVGVTYLPWQPSATCGSFALVYGFVRGTEFRTAKRKGRRFIWPYSIPAEVRGAVRPQIERSFAVLNALSIHARDCQFLIEGSRSTLIDFDDYRDAESPEMAAALNAEYRDALLGRTRVDGRRARP